MIVTLDEMKEYLRVDFDDDDTLIESILTTAEKMCMDISRTETLAEFKNSQYSKVSVMYAAAYLYEHREDADHHALMLTLRSLLSSIRKEGF